MSSWDLPTSIEISGRVHEFRSDFRAVLDVLTILDDVEISDGERGADSMDIFYCDFSSIPTDDMDKARDYMLWFVRGGDMAVKAPKRKIADWKQDFPLIIAPVNRVLGYESRTCDYLHWWTFLAAYYEVGDCLFAQVVSIRAKKAKGKKLEKWERDFYCENRTLIDFQIEETETEKEILEEWLV